MLRRILGGLLLIPVFVAEPAAACSCGPWPTPPEAFEAAAGVFAGTVVAITQADAETVQVELAVSHVWKGPVSAALFVWTAENDAMCGYPFETGEAYLVYAYGEPYWTSYCDRTNPLAFASEDLEWLGEGTPVASEPGTPHTRSSLSPVFPNPFRTAAHVDVTLDRPGCATLRVVDLQGRLIRDLPRAACYSGRQQVRIDLGETPAGTYVVELQTANEVHRRRLTLIR